ncbi:MAG: hypothetical protein AAB637_01285 [Patescibacteria group bacterium]
MPNGCERKEYGPHSYLKENDGTGDCTYGCGCWAGPSRSGGPLGLDPIHGLCPKNLLEGEPSEDENHDYEAVVMRRIEALELRAYKAEEALKKVAPDKLELARQLEKAKKELAIYKVTVERTKIILGSI